MDKNYKLVYNPKRINGQINKAKVTDMYAQREGGRPEGRLLEKPAVYSIAPNELKKFRTDIADYLLSKFGFLQAVEPDKVDKTLAEMKEKRYKCRLCVFESDTEIAVKGHMRSHKLSEEAEKILAEIPEAKAEAYVIGAEYSGTGQTKFVSPEEAEGIPFTSSESPQQSKADSDGVGWYGRGLETQRRGGQRRVIQGGTPGQRPAYASGF